MSCPRCMEASGLCRECEDYLFRDQKQSLVDWLEERKLNALRIAQTKTGEDKTGWLEDAAYFSLAERVARNSRSSPPEQNHLLAYKEQRNGWSYIGCTCGIEIGPFHNEEYASDAFDVHAGSFLARMYAKDGK